MMAKTKAERHWDREEGIETAIGARMRAAFKKYKGLADIQAKYGDFFEAMMVRVVKNLLRPGQDVSTKLCSVRKYHGTRIGCGLAVALSAHLTSEAAVDEWIHRYPALVELDSTEVWFRPMMNVVAQRLLGEVSWGLKLRVFIGAGLSVLDMGSDINVIALYWRAPATVGFGNSLMVMVAACLLFQLFLTFVQNRNKGKGMKRGKFFIEVLLLLTGLRPGLDAYRVASGAEMEEGAAMDPVTDLVVMKTIEVL
jgi:hypothetical protein